MICSCVEKIRKQVPPSDFDFKCKTDYNRKSKYKEEWEDITSISDLEDEDFNYFQK